MLTAPSSLKLSPAYTFESVISSVLLISLASLPFSFSVSLTSVRPLRISTRLRTRLPPGRSSLLTLHVLQEVDIPGRGFSYHLYCCRLSGSFRLPQVIGSYLKGIRETWESHREPETAFQLGVLLPGMGFGSGKPLLGPGAPELS